MPARHRLGAAEGDAAGHGGLQPARRLEAKSFASKEVLLWKSGATVKPAAARRELSNSRKLSLKPRIEYMYDTRRVRE